MRILILGGTEFLGRHVVEAALANGHEVTLFNRGHTNPSFGDRALIIRPGLIVGPHDPTDRFTYWVRRFSQGGEVLVPGRRDYSVQFIDARDLAKWTIRMVEHKVFGVFNATGPETELTMEKLVRALTGGLWAGRLLIHARTDVPMLESRICPSIFDEIGEGRAWEVFFLKNLMISLVRMAFIKSCYSHFPLMNRGEDSIKNWAIMTHGLGRSE